MGISMNKAQFISLFLESIMYGVALTLCCITVLLLLRMRAEGGIADKRLMLVLSLMMIVATLHVIISFIRGIDAFLSLQGLATTLYFANFKNVLYIIKDSCFIIQTTLGDAVNIWRCYIVWGRKPLVVLAPFLMMVTGEVSACLALATAATSKPGSTIFEVPKRYITAGAVLMMCTNVYCTAVICFKIYRSGRYHPTFSNFIPIIIVIVETGALYTFALLAFLGVYLSGSNGQFVSLDLITPLVPCIFCLIILQIKFHHSDLSSHSRSGASQSRLSESRRTTPFWNRRQDRASGIPLANYPPPVAVQISNVAEQDGDLESVHKIGEGGSIRSAV